LTNHKSNIDTVVILAAGRGARFGGSKQFARFGKHQKTLMEYNLYHAFDTGFNHVVFITQKNLYQQLNQQVINHLPKSIKAEVIFQDNHKLPNRCSVDKKRQKPLGTAHALWCAKALLSSPFVVINADDYYGRQAFKLAKNTMSFESACMIAYKVEQTLSQHGGVNRGICQLSATGYLSKLAEITNITLNDYQQLIGMNEQAQEVTLQPNELVSMNFWCFNPSIFNAIESELIKTFSQSSSPDIECYLPNAAIHMTECSQHPIKVLTSQDMWFGVTYAADSHSVDVKINALINAGMFSSINN